MSLRFIVARTRETLEKRKRRKPLRKFEEELEASRRGLEAMLQRKSTSVLLSCQRTRPGLEKKPLRRAFPELAVASDAIADAVLVSTERHFHSGEMGDLRAVSNAVSLPVVMDDFIVDPWQVAEARLREADAVVLRLSILDDMAYRLCHEAADRWDVDVLTEVSDKEEMRRAVRLRARIIVIQNRDLETGKVDLSRTERLAAEAPPERVVLSSGGVDDRQTLRNLRKHVDGFVVDPELTRRDDVDVALRRMVFGGVRIDGISQSGDARLAWMSGATWGGLVFDPDSDRSVNAKTAASICLSAPLAWCGIFDVRDDPADAAAIAKQLRLSAIDLRGGADRKMTRAWRRALPESAELWVAAATRSEAREALAGGAARYVSGKAVPGDGLKHSAWVRSGDVDLERLDVDDVDEPWLLSVDEQIETSPRVKSAQKLRVLFDALRGRGRRGRLEDKQRRRKRRS